MRTLPAVLTTLSLAVGATGSLAAGPAAASIGAPPRAVEANTTAAANCRIVVGSATAGGYHVRTPITSTTPPVIGTSTYQPHTYPSGWVRLSTTFNNWPKAGGKEARYGWFVHGDTLYTHHYGLKNGAPDPALPAKYTKLGGGWGPYSALEVSNYYRGQTLARQTAYALRTDGTLRRWSISSTGKWTPTGAATGFSAVRSIALISRTATYDTFIANLRGGALYTIHLPTTAPLKPVVKQVRTTGWGEFEQLVAATCGKGSLVIGVDRQSKYGQLYAVGHATGLSTPIKHLGELDALMFRTPDPAFFRWTDNPPTDALAGE
ncbi:hypothetical protein GCM10009554_52940 [Kribbella koreensis]|uniref:Tachylectin n=1 Tax=Kribbella koreensis TaxID=57909 RepID=A0ABN1R3T9_9ACTN